MFAIGDVVRLKSGGPNMVVTKSYSRGTGDLAVDTAWCDATGPLHTAFNLEAGAVDAVGGEPALAKGKK